MEVHAYPSCWKIGLLAFLGGWVAAWAGVAGEAALPDVIARAPRGPRAGEWAEYRLTLPRDPLEAALADGEEEALLPPAPLDWGRRLTAEERVQPRPAPAAPSLPAREEVHAVRVSVLAREEGGDWRVRLTTAGGTYEIDWRPPETPVSGDGGDGPAPAPERREMTLHGRTLAVEVRTAERPDGGTLTWWTSSEAPWGLARWTWEGGDWRLAGFGAAPEPPFPLPDP